LATRHERHTRSRILNSLVDGLAQQVYPRGEVVSLLPSNLGRRDRELDALCRRAGVGPEVDPERTLGVERVREHELAGHHPAVPEVLARPVRDHGHLVAVAEQADAELQARLSRADDRHLRHAVPSPPTLSSTWVSQEPPAFAP